MKKQTKIYFAASIRGGRSDAPLYADLISYLQTYASVLTEHIGDVHLEEFGEKQLTDKQIHDRDLQWLMESDLVFAEVTTPSLGVGYEIGRAIEKGKRVVALFRTTKGKRVSAMIAGNNQIELYEYKNLEQAKGIIDQLLG